MRQRGRANRSRESAAAALGKRLVAVAALGSTGCASQGSAEVAIPGSSAKAEPVAAVEPPASALVMPSKDPAEEAWSADGAVCMPPYLTRQDEPGQVSCGGAPGDWIGKSRFGCAACDYWQDEEVTAAQSKARRVRVCCYHVERYAHHHHRGRPLEGPAGAVTAASTRGADWLAALVAEVPRDARAAARWKRAALEEHASVAAFARLSLSLLLLGAPSNLVRGAHEAALEEVAHARLSFAVASAYAGRTIGPGPLPVGAASPPAVTLRALFEETLRGGCVGEALAALSARRQAARTRPPALRLALARLAEDEGRHAELAARIAAWCVMSASPAEKSAMARYVDEVTTLPPRNRVERQDFERAVRPLLERLGARAAEVTA